jgi:membrane protease YdiL (CAAX protease family)
MLATILFGQFIWSLAPIPGPEYPYADRIWELNAAQQSLVFTSTLGRYSPFEEAFNPKYLGAGAAFGLVIFFVLYFLRLPIMLIYGILRGLNNTLPHVILPQFIGACIGRFYFQRRMGLKWRQYIPVVAAGFSCGMGLITVLAVGINFLKRSVIQIPF